MKTTILLTDGKGEMTGIEVYGRTGKQNAEKFSFINRTSASDLRKELKGLGFAKSELTKEVNRILSGETTLALVKKAAFDAHCAKLGLVPVEGRISANGKKATTQWIKPGRVAKTTTGKKSGLTEDERNELAELRAKFAAASTPKTEAAAA